MLQRYGAVERRKHNCHEQAGAPDETLRRGDSRLRCMESRFRPVGELPAPKWPLLFWKMPYFRLMSRKELKLHACFWVVFAGLDFLLELVERGQEIFSTWLLLQNSGFILLQMLVFYLNYAWICPKTIPSQRWFLFALGELGLLLLFPALRFGFEEIVLYYITGAHNYPVATLTPQFYIYDNSYFVIRILVVSIAAYALRHVWRTNQEMSRLLLEKNKAELSALKNQLSPHFLFNTLNSFYSDLYDTAPKVAEDILTLSEMLRYVTYENRGDSVLLRDDLEFIRKYIVLFGRRFDGAIAVEYDFPQDAANYRVPSLLLIHFVENAFKHGRLDDAEHPVTISGEIRGNEFIFKVGNTKGSGQHYDERGIGQQNISHRLDILFPGKQVLHIRESETRYDVTLTLPLWQSATT